MTTSAIDIVRSAVRATASEPARSTPGGAARRQRPVVTISRATGVDPGPIAEGVRRVLEMHRRARDPAWLVYDRRLVERVAEDSDLSTDLVASLDERDKTWFEHYTLGLKGEATGYDLALRMSRTIRALSRVGNAIIVGRGSQCILQNHAHAVHVRLDAPLDWRIQRFVEREHLDEGAAKKALRVRDDERAAYVHTHFHRNIDDVALYHLSLNVARVDPTAAAAAIAVVVEGGAGLEG